MAAPSYRLQAQIPAPCEGQLKQLSEMLEINPSDVVVEALGLFTKAVLEARRGHVLAFVDEQRQVLAEYSSPSLTRLEWNARDESNLVLPDGDFDRVAAELEQPAKAPARLKALARRKSR
jgi:hypothetical protein